MSRSDNGWDSATMERFFSTFNSERKSRSACWMRDEAADRTHGRQSNTDFHQPTKRAEAFCIGMLTRLA